CLAALVYPFKPFGNRRNAGWSVLACFMSLAVLSLISHAALPAKPNDVSADEWARREKLCRDDSGPMTKCMVAAIKDAELERAAKRRALEAKVDEAKRKADQKAQAEAKGRNDHAKYVEMLKREAESLADGVDLKDAFKTKEGIFVTVAMFGAMAKLYE